MLDFVLAFLVGVMCAFIAHEGVRTANVHFRELDMSPNWSAIIAFIFGFSGILALVVYGAVKVMIKRMIKH